MFLPSLLVLVSGCATGNGPISFFPTSTPLPAPQVGITSVPDVTPVMNAFLDALKREDYASMYALLNKATQAGITPGAVCDTLPRGAQHDERGQPGL